MIPESVFDEDPELDGGEAPELHFTDVGNAKRLVLAHGDQFRYVATWGTWLVWDGRRWKRDALGEVVEAAKGVARSLWAEVPTAREDVRKALSRWAGQSESANRIEAMVRLARTDPAVAVDVVDLDADPWLLNVANGTVDLRTGRLRPHLQVDLITKVAPVVYDPAACCPTWVAFLDRVLPDPEVRSFLAEAVGYALVGTVNEHVVFFAHGAGANGKTTLLETLLGILGDYGRQAEPDLLLASRESHPTGVADLLGARLVVSTEIDDGRKLAEATVKRLTGGDRLKARYMRQDFFEFDPTHTLFMASNHRPVVRGTDNAIWRRLRLIPFAVTIPAAEQDHHLIEKLSAEASGILAWAVEGCLRWRQAGLSTPPAVMAATADYRADMDVLGAFIDEYCILAEDAHVSADDLRRSYVEWSEANGEQALSARRLGAALAERGFEHRKHGPQRRWHWFGFGLLNPRTHVNPESRLNSHTHAREAGIGKMGSEGFMGSEQAALLPSGAGR